MSAVDLVGVKIWFAHLKALKMRMRKLVFDLSVARILPEKINKLFLPKLGFIDVLSTVIKKYGSHTKAFFSLFQSLSGYRVSPNIAKSVLCLPKKGSSLAGLFWKLWPFCMILSFEIRSSLFIKKKSLYKSLQNVRLWVDLSSTKAHYIGTLMLYCITNKLLQQRSNNI